MAILVKSDSCDKVDQFTKPLLTQIGIGVNLGQNAFEWRIDFLDGFHGLVNELADLRLLGPILKELPACFLGHEEDIVGQVFVSVLRVGPFKLALTFFQFLVQVVEGVGDVFEKDQPQNDMLILRRIHIVAQLIRRRPERSFQFVVICH